MIMDLIAVNETKSNETYVDFNADISQSSLDKNKEKFKSGAIKILVCYNSPTAELRRI